MVIVYVILSISWLFVWFYFVRKEIGLTFLGLAKNILPYALTMGVTIAVSWYFTRNITNMYLMLVAKIATAVPVYIGILWMFNCGILKEAFHYVLQKRHKD
jgi:hypothetical protein